MAQHLLNHGGGAFSRAYYAEISQVTPPFRLAHRLRAENGAGRHMSLRSLERQYNSRYEAHIWARQGGLTDAHTPGIDFQGSTRLRGSTHLRRSRSLMRGRGHRHWVLPSTYNLSGFPFSSACNGEREPWNQDEASDELNEGGVDLPRMESLCGKTGSTKQSKRAKIHTTHRKMTGASCTMLCRDSCANRQEMPWMAFGSWRTPYCMGGSILCHG